MALGDKQKERMATAKCTVKRKQIRKSTKRSDDVENETLSRVKVRFAPLACHLPALLSFLCYFKQWTKKKKKKGTAKGKLWFLKERKRGIKEKILRFCLVKRRGWCASALWVNPRRSRCLIPLCSITKASSLSTILDFFLLLSFPLATTTQKTANVKCQVRVSLQLATTAKNCKSAQALKAHPYFFIFSTPFQLVQLWKLKNAKIVFLWN